MRRPKLYIIVILLSSPFVFFSGCLEFEFVNQPSSILPGETFTVFIEVTVSSDDRGFEPRFGICLPDGWVIPGDTVLCTGVYTEAIVYDVNLAQEQEDQSPAPEGYYWWVGDGNDVGQAHGIAYGEVTVQTDMQTGVFSIDYMLGSAFLGPIGADRSNDHRIEVVDEHTPRELKTIVAGDTAYLSWTAPFTGEGLIGYNVYRDGHLLTANPVVETAYTDENLTAGVFYYSVSSVFEGTRENLTPYETKALVFSGGTGEPNAPFKIAAAEQLVSITEFPDLWHKHFVLAGDINLDPNLPGGWVLDQPVISTFHGTFDGDDHTISHLTIECRDASGPLGLFGELAVGSTVKNLAIEDANITGTGDSIGGLAGTNFGDLMSCRTTGVVAGDGIVGGLVGNNAGSITTSNSDCMVSGGWTVGGLAADNEGRVTNCYSTGTVSGDSRVGGLVGDNSGSITISYSTGGVSGTDSKIGGLVGWNGGRIATCYSAGAVSDLRSAGGLVGGGFSNRVVDSFWDIWTSGHGASVGGIGRTTVQLQDVNTYLNVGWDFVDETLNGACDYWHTSHGEYPQLRYHFGSNPVMPEGSGTAEQPYLIRDIRDLGTVWFVPMAHYRLERSVDLSGITWSGAVVSSFGGIFDGNGYVISNLHIRGGEHLGLFGQLAESAEVLNLGLESVDIHGTGDHVGGLAGDNNGSIAASYCSGSLRGDDRVGGLVGSNDEGMITISYSTATVQGNVHVGGLVGDNDSHVTDCYSTGTVRGNIYVGGLAGTSSGNIAESNSTGTVNGDEQVGGLVGGNTGEIVTSGGTGAVSGDSRVGGLVGENEGIITTSFSTGRVTGGGWSVGGLVGMNSWRRSAEINASYAMGPVSGYEHVGGLVGFNYGTITTSYSAGRVTGSIDVGGLVGNGGHDITTSFWDVETSGLLGSNGGVGLTTAEMMDPEIIGLNGLADDPNWVLDPGKDYPCLVWEGTVGQLIPQPQVNWMDGDGTADVPYRIASVDQLVKLTKASALADKHYILVNDLDLTGLSWFQAVIPFFSGALNGNGFSIRNVSIQGGNHLGFIGILQEGSVTNLGLDNISVEGTGNAIGGLVGWNTEGSIVNCYSTGMLSGRSHVGGIAGGNDGRIAASYSTGAVTATDRWGCAGGVAGSNSSRITSSYAMGPVTGNGDVGGLVGDNHGRIITSYSTGKVSGEADVGGLVGDNSRNITTSFWDVETSGLMGSDGGVGLTTAEMLDPEIIGLNGLADDPNWVLDPGKDYPHLIWEGTVGEPIPQPQIDWMDGDGTPDMPYQIGNSDQLVRLSKASALTDKHFILINDLDLAGLSWFQAVIPFFSGSFNGNGFRIQNVSIQGGNHLGFIGILQEGSVANLGLDNISIEGTGDMIGTLAGRNDDGSITNCYGTGTLAGDRYVGGLVGSNYGGITTSYSAATVIGERTVGGLAGVGSDSHAVACFWDIEISGQSRSAGGIGKTTAEMQTASTFIEAGWDFVDEIENGSEDIWWILEGQDYPRLWWQLVPEN